MSVTIGSKVYSSPAVLRTKIQEAAGSVMQTQGMADYVEVIADGYLALDNTKSDLDKKKNAVSIAQEGLTVTAERSKDGNLESFEMIDERGDEPKTLRKTMVDGLASYEISMGGQNLTIAEDVNGTLFFDLGK